MNLITQRARAFVDALPIPSFKLLSSLKRFAGQKNLVPIGLVAAILVASSALAPITASAASCQVKDGSIVIPIGGVGTYGDLKIRHATVGAIDPTGGYESTAIVDLKAPGFLVSGARLPGGTPQKFSICGQEVTITFFTSYGGYTTFGVSTF